MAHSRCLATRDVAWGELARRHNAYLVAVLRRCRDGDAEDHAQNTLVRARDFAGTYDPGSELGRAAQRRRVRAWLGQIARHAYIDDAEILKQVLDAAAEMDRRRTHVRSRLTSGLPVCADESGLGQERSWDASIVTRVRKALARLSDNQRLALLTWMEHYELDKLAEEQHLPQAVMNELVQRLGKKPDNIRQIRLRAVKSIEKSIGLPRRDWPMNREKRRSRHG